MNASEGDLIKFALDARFDVIIHGCNCQCVMGAGIAKIIKQTFPDAYKADLATKKGSREKLGSISAATVTRGAHQITIVNGYTQFHWCRSGVLVDYDDVRIVIREVKARFGSRRFGYPRIGAGLAKGHWGINCGDHRYRTCRRGHSGGIQALRSSPRLSAECPLSRQSRC
jgi:O-acetyl-ADP-ribose deacetylase (regulator of RNase III)